MLINAPFVFNALWGIVRPWLQQQTLDKVSHACRSPWVETSEPDAARENGWRGLGRGRALPDALASLVVVRRAPWLGPAATSAAQIAIHGRTGYHEQFRKWYHVKDLPVSLGGTCSCPGGCVKNVPGAQFMVDGLQQIEIANGTAYELPLAVPVGATVTWEFNVRAYDVKFFVKFAAEGKQPAKTVVAESTVLTGKTVKGSFETPAQGTVTLVWDNSYSFLRNKNVAYKVDLSAPSTASTDALSNVAPSESGTLEAALAAELAEAKLTSA